MLCWLGGVIVWLAGGRADAASYLQEGFNYPPGILGTNAPWMNPTNLISVTNSGLAYPFLMDFLPPAYAVTVSQGNRSVTYRPLSTVATGGSVYFSFLINFTTQPGNYYIAGLTQSTNVPPGGAADDPLDLIDGGANNNLGIRAMGGTTSYLTNGTASLTTNTTCFVVMKYNFTNGTASLFFNPPAGNTEPATPDAASTAAAIVPNLSYVYLRVGSSTAGNFQISALRVASTWAEVTPATNSANACAQAAMLSAFLDSLQVNNYWLEGASVNWLTGVAGGSGPNMTIGTDSHCSAYAGAVTDLLGVYLLRQPYASDLNLANNQANWLATNTAGWFPISTMTVAQHLVNTGELVVASYQASSGSGHIAVLRPSNRTDASVNAFGPEECQSGDNNFLSTNIVTGFNQHPGAFPSNILYYGHALNYPVGTTWPLFTQSAVTGQNFRANMTTIVGRKYQTQWSSDLTTWNSLLTFTNSNSPITFYTNSTFSDSAVSAKKFYRLVPQ